MSYAAGEVLVLAAVVAITGNPTPWASTGTKPNAGIGKWNLLDSGNSDHYAILKPGAGSNEFITLAQARRTYHTVIEVWQSYLDDGTSLTSLETLAEAIIAKFDAKRKLGDTTSTVEDAFCSSWDVAQEMWEKGGNGPRWLRQDFTIEWKEDANVTYAE